MARRLAQRQSIGDPKAANDNAPWPLASQLKREGNDVLLLVAERYRAVYDAASYEPQLVGREPDDMLVLDARQVTKEDGTVTYKGVRSERLKRHEAANDNGPSADKKPVTFQPRPGKPAPAKWNGDAGLIAHIDGARMLRRLQVALGPLLEPFEDAVLHGETLSAIGESKGMNSVARGPGGRVLVMMGLEAVQRVFAEIDREENKIA